MAAAGQSPDIETEIKISISNLARTRRLLRTHGFRLLSRRALESNLIYDTPAEYLRRNASLLRLRLWGRETILTYKGRPTEGRHKSREELELTIGDLSTMGSILEKLGFQPTYYYEKFRSLYGKPRASGCIALDETPIGAFLELEGDANWIDRTARLLGFAPEQYITRSYAALYLEHCSRLGIEPTAMVFATSARGRAIGSAKKGT